MRFGINKVADALAVIRKPDAREETNTLDMADLKALETSLVARLANMSDGQRAQVINSAIDILRTKNAGWEAEAEVRRILDQAAAQPAHPARNRSTCAPTDRPSAAAPEASAAVGRQNDTTRRQSPLSVLRRRSVLLSTHSPVFVNS
jgi:hypothetical protein